jgi:hypothetical protein
MQRAIIPKATLPSNNYKSIKTIKQMALGLVTT